MTVITRQENALQITTEIILSKVQKKSPVVIAVDGGSGAGKSIFVKQLAAPTKATVIPLDDFYSADIPNERWDRYTIIEKLDRVFQWERLIKTVLRPLMDGQRASYTTYDFSSIQPDGTYQQHSDLKTLDSSKIIIIEGSYSASPCVSKFVDIAIIIDALAEERHQRLRSREKSEFLKEWHKKWDIVEDYYFTEVRPRESYDIVINNSDTQNHNL